MASFLDEVGQSFKEALPSVVTGDAPSVQNIAEGFRQRGPWGGLLNSLSQLDELGTDIARDFTAYGDVEALRSGQLNQGQAALATLGAVLGIAGAAGGPRAYRAARARADVSEVGVLDMRQLFPSVEERPLYPAIRAPRRNPTRTHRFDYKTALFLGTKTFDELVNVATIDKPDLSPVGRAAYGGFWQNVGRRAGEEAPGFVDFPTLGPEKGEVAAAALIHSWIDSLDRQGALKGRLGDTYDRLRTNPESLFPGGLKSEELVELEDLAVTLAREFDDVDSPSLVLPPHKTVAGVEMTPEGPRVGIAHAAVEFRKRWDTDLTKDDRDRHFWERTFHVNFDALVPDMASNLLHQMGYIVTPGEIELGLQWYQRAHDAAQDLTEVAGRSGRSLSLRQAAGIISLFSGRTEWNENVRVARHFVEHGEIPADAPVDRALVPKAKAILDGAEPEIKSDKQRNFFANIENPHDWTPATMDRHAMDAALGFNTQTAGRLLFDHTPTYEAFADAYRIAAKIEGLITNQVQAITWDATRRTKGLRSADHRLGLGRGDQVEFSFPRNSRDYLEGTVEGDNLLSLLKRAQGDDPGVVGISLPRQKRIRGKALKGSSDWALLEVRNPDGTTSVWLREPSEEASVAIRSSTPLFRDDEVGLSFLVPVTPRVVDSADEVLRSALDLSAERGATTWPLLERHLASPAGHDPLVPGNRLVLQVPADNAHAVKALKKELEAAALPFETKDLTPFQRYELPPVDEVDAGEPRVPTPVVYTGLEINLPDNVPVDIIDELWVLASRFSEETRIPVKRVAYLHGDIGPKGSARVAEHHVQDAGGRRGIVRTRTNSAEDLNGTWVYVDEAEAARLDNFDTGAATGRRVAAVGRPTDGGATSDAVLNNELRLLFAHLKDDESTPVKVATKNVLFTKVGSKTPRHFAVCYTPGKQPALAFGTSVEEAQQVLQQRVGATPGEIVVGSVTGRGSAASVVLTPPVHPKDPTRHDRVVGHQVRHILSRYGVALDRIEVLSKVAGVAEQQ